MVEALGALVILSFITLAANLALEERNILRWVKVALALLNVLFLLIAGLNLAVATMDEDTRQAMNLPDIELQNALASFAVFGVMVAVASALLFDSVRLKLVRFFPRREAASVKYTLDGVLYPTTPLSGYDPRNPVHMVALIFCTYLLGSQLASFALQGGLAGLADDIGVTWELLLANFLPQLILPILGVGLLMRRTWRQAAERLGFTNLTLESLIAGVGASVIMFMAVMFLAVVWSLVVSPETFEEQNEATSALAESINTVWLAFGVAFTAAVGEELVFRGALQPIFGFWFTAVIFTLIHIQYALTPATLIIFLVALTFGWLRQRYNIYAAMVAHFCYNFIGLLLSLLAS